MLDLPHGRVSTMNDVSLPESRRDFAANGCPTVRFFGGDGRTWGKTPPREHHLVIMSAARPLASFSPVDSLLPFTWPADTAALFEHAQSAQRSYLSP